MISTEKMAAKIGSNVKSHLNIDEEKEEIVVYGAINLLQIVFSILWVMIFGLLLGVFFEALLFSCTNAILRKYSGGVHASSPSRCIIIGTSIASIAGVLVHYVLYKLNVFTVLFISLILIAFAFIVIIKNAPVDSINKPITSMKAKKEFKIKSVITIFIALFAILILFILNQRHLNLYYIKFIECIALGVFWQSITLTKLGISLLTKVDFILKCILERNESYSKQP